MHCSKRTRAHRGGEKGIRELRWFQRHLEMHNETYFTSYVRAISHGNENERN